MQMEKSVWQGEFVRYDFQFEGREAILILPPEAKRTAKWMLKTEYFGAFPALECELLRRGWHLAYLKNINRWGLDEDMDAKLRFRDFLVKEFALEEKCVPVGMSCGGLHAVKLAARHPEMVHALYLDAPLINILSYPFGFGGGAVREEKVCREALDALGLTMPEMIAYREHPLDKLGALVENRIPLVLVWGDVDRTVPFEENGRFVVKAYEGTGIPAMPLCKPGCGHHPHGPYEQDLSRTADFIEEMSRQ